MSTQDPERLQAEQLAHQLQLLHEPDMGSERQLALRAEIAELSDEDLRLRIVRLRLTAPTNTRSAALRSTLNLLRARGGYSDPVSDDDLTTDLAERWGLQVADDGLLECDRIDARLAWVGDLPFALHHHTSTALLPAIREEGLRIGKPTNFFNTQAGVYVSTMQAGQPVSVYSQRAVRVHGGEPTTIRVARRMQDLTPDPDDTDLAWAQGRQFVTPFVPPEDLRWDAEPDGADEDTAPRQRPQIAS